MKIIRAEHLGMCFGVRDAIALALDTAKREPLTILGDLVHNETVLGELRVRRIGIEQQPDNVRTQTVMVTAHGTSERVLRQTRERGLNVLEATCPLVHVAHRALAKLVVDGFHPVIVGKRDHVEVRGLTDDLGDHDVVLSESDVANLQTRARFGVMAQTTQPIERVRQLVQLLRQTFPHSEVRFVDTVCQPTKQRQHAAVELAQQCDVVIVIGGASSNNTRELVATCSQYCGRVHHVQTVGDLQADWFSNHDTVGLTAGTSTPDIVIAGVEQWLNALATKLNNSTRRTAMNYTKWIEHFQRNRQNRPEPDWSASINIPSHVLPPMLRSIEEFRLGDGGGPASLIAYDAECFRSSTAEMRTIVDLWFKEEAEHARLLGCAVKRFNGRIITSHWSFTAFCLCRRVLGVRFELQVLTLTELVSTAYYRMLRHYSPDGPLTAMCELILRDEAGHVAFQRDRIMSSGHPKPGLRGLFWRIQFLLCGYAAGTVLWSSHAPCLKAIGGSRAEFYSEITQQITRFIRSLRRGQKSARTPALWAKPSTRLQLAN